MPNQTETSRWKFHAKQCAKGIIVLCTATLSMLGIIKLADRAPEEPREDSSQSLIPQTRSKLTLDNITVDHQVTNRPYQTTTQSRVKAQHREQYQSAITYYEPTEDHTVPVLQLHGSHYKMGKEYGIHMKDKLNAVLEILKNYYIDQHNIPYSSLIAQADLFYSRYSYHYQSFLQGISHGSGLPIADCKILNAMETLNALISDTPISQCAFLFIPPNKTKRQSAIIGRNYDFPPPFDECAKFLTVTILHEPNSHPTAFISMPGQIYCPSCINSASLFMELNNGQPSGGFFVDEQRQSLLIRLLEIMQNSGDYTQIEQQLRATQSDYSLIINTADHQRVRSFEFSSTDGMRVYTPSQDKTFVSTNFFLNNTWSDLPTPSDNTTWFGVTRRRNLMDLSSESSTHTASSVQTIMDRKIEDGGAVWDFTIYQMIFDTNDGSLYLKATQHQSNWTKIPLTTLLNQQPTPQSNPYTWSILISGATGSILTGALIWSTCSCKASRKKSDQHPATENDPLVRKF